MKILFFILFNFPIILLSQNCENKIIYSNKGNVEKRLSLINGKLDGTSLTYYESGNIKEVQFYKQNIKQGEWVIFDDKKNKIMSIHYLNNMKNGECLVWDSNGIVRVKMNYKNNKKIGTWIMRDETGYIIKVKDY